MPVEMHGKTYEFVAERMASLHRDHGDDYDLNTDLTVDDPETGRIQTKSYLTLYKTLRDGEWVPIPDGRTKTGLAEEVRNSSNITTTSALETCETSSIGRALAAAGYHPDGSYASADEVEHALEQQENLPVRKSNGDAVQMQSPATQKPQVTDKPFGMINKYDKPCVKCGKNVPEYTGWTEKVVLAVDPTTGKEQVRWDTRCAKDGECQTETAEPTPPVIGDDDELPF